MVELEKKRWTRVAYLSSGIDTGTTRTRIQPSKSLTLSWKCIRSQDADELLLHWARWRPTISLLHNSRCKLSPSAQSFHCESDDHSRLLSTKDCCKPNDSQITIKLPRHTSVSHMTAGDWSHSSFPSIITALIFWGHFKLPSEWLLSVANAVTLGFYIRCKCFFSTKWVTLSELLIALWMWNLHHNCF